MTATITSLDLCVPNAAGMPLPIVLVEFDPAAFVSSQFADAGIACPPHVQRSVPKRQAEFFYGRLAARRALQAAAIEPVQVAIGPAREPLWPAGVVGSITHSGRLAAACVLRSPPHAGVGIDIEHTVDEDQQAALLSMAIAPAEVQRLQAACPELPFATLLTLAFSAKESLFKGAYAAVGRYFDFDAVQVTALDPIGRTVALTVQDTLCPQLPGGQVCRVHYTCLHPGAVITAYVR